MAAWSRGMILPLGGSGLGFDSRSGPYFWNFFCSTGTSQLAAVLNAAVDYIFLVRMSAHVRISFRSVLWVVRDKNNNNVGFT